MAARSTHAPLRFAMIGCGIISHAHGRAAGRSGGKVRFVACASRNAERAAAWAREHGCDRSYTDLDTMLAAETLDAVVIATWPADHRRHIDACLDAGVRHVLCEKALATSAADALAIWTRARAARARVVEGYMYRHHPAFAELLRRLRDPACGPLDSLYASFHMYDPEAGDAGDTWRRQPERGGVPHDFLCYPVDAANRLAGALPVRVSALGARSVRFGTLHRLYGHVEYDNGVVATVESSRKSVFAQRLQVSCAQRELVLCPAWSSAGEAVLEETTSPEFLRRETVVHRFPPSIAHDGRLVDLPVFGAQLENFADAVRGLARPCIELEESVINALVLDGLVASLARRRTMEIAVPADLRAALAAQRGADGSR